VISRKWSYNRGSPPGHDAPVKTPSIYGGYSPADVSRERHKKDHHLDRSEGDTYGLGTEVWIQRPTLTKCPETQRGEMWTKRAPLPAAAARRRVRSSRKEKPPRKPIRTATSPTSSAHPTTGITSFSSSSTFPVRTHHLPRFPFSSCPSGTMVSSLGSLADLPLVHLGPQLGQVTWSCPLH